MEDKELRFTGMNVKKEGDVIVVSMEDYAKSLEKIDIRKGMPDDPLTEGGDENIQKVCWKVIMVGK